MTVVDGGRPDDAPPSKSGRPDLRVAGQEEEGETDDDAGPAPSVKVRVLRPSELGRKPDVARTDALQHGIVELAAAGERQWIYHGSAPARYRVYCTSGKMALPAGEERILIGPGQSTDIEAKELCATAEAPGTAGRYLHLKT